MEIRRPRSAVAERLLSAGTEAFHKHLLPALRIQLPEVVDRVLVSITSSVAVGTADDASDLDMFVIFPLHADYRRFAEPLGDIISKLDLDRKYGAICDKGMRFELESLHRADLAAIYHRPFSMTNWHRQTPWLLNWLLESIPIHDPQGVHEKLRKRCGTWPPQILAAKQDIARTRITTWGCIARQELEREGVTYVALRASARILHVAIELAYLLAQRLPPHPKWREARSTELLGNKSSADVINNCRELFRSSFADAFDLGFQLGKFVHSHGMQAEPFRGDLAAQVAQPVYANDGQCYWLVNELAPHAMLLRHTAAIAGREPVYLAQDTGADHLTSSGLTYNRSMRVSDSVRWALHHKKLLIPPLVRPDGSAILARRWLYYNFIIWRKLRVVDKAHLRGQALTTYLYQHQVVDHLIEAFSRLNGGYAPPTHLANAETLGSLPAPLRDVVCDPAILLTHFTSAKTFSAWAWAAFRSLQQKLVARRLLPASAAADPLATQWEVQYWRYEDMFS